MLVSFNQIEDFLEKIAPPFLAYDWDNCGPQIKISSQKEIHKVLLALDPTNYAVHQGIETGAQVIITHHPLLFDPPQNIDTATSKGEKISNLIENGISLYSIHTSFDRARRGLSHALAQKLEISEPKPLIPAQEAYLYKFVTFVPSDKEEALKKAIFDAGGGRLGQYSHCSFSSEGRGTFKPLADANPYKGTPGQLERVGESRIEVQLSREVINKVIKAAKDAHPYEEMAYDIFSLDKTDPTVGLGRYGSWPDRPQLPDAVDFITRTLDVAEENLTLTGNEKDRMSKVGILPGAGGSALDRVLERNLDLLITGEVDYHERLKAAEERLNLIEIGHFNSEKIFLPWVGQLLGKKFADTDLRVELCKEEPNL